MHAVFYLWLNAFKNEMGDISSILCLVNSSVFCKQ